MSALGFAAILAGVIAGLDLLAFGVTALLRLFRGVS